MAGNTESQYGAAGTEGGSGAAAAGAYAPPIMHSWCLQPDGPREQVSSVANDADDDCGFDLNLGLSLGGAAPKSSSKAKTKEKEVVLDRDAFREKEKEATASEEPAAAPPQGGVMFKPLKSEQGGSGGGGNNSTRVQSFWQDLDRSGNEKQAVEVASSVNWAGVNSVAEDSKMFAQHMWQALQGKAAQAEHQRVPLSARDEASLIKELQGLPPQAVATAAAWARVVAQDGFPVQLLEAIRDGVESQGSLQRSKSVASEPALSAGGGGPSNNINDLERSDSDVSKNMQHAAIIQQQELVEQQRKRELQTQKRQEARRKRKALLEGQKSKKTSKKEESGSLDSNPNQLRRTSSLQPSKENSVTAASSPPDSQDASSMSAFRRPTGSSAWLHNWEGTKGGDPESKLPPQDSGDIRRTLERARAKDGGDSNNAQVDSSSESRKVGSPDVGQLQRMDLDRTRTESGPPMAAQIDPSWIQRIMEVQRNSHQQGTAVTMENHGAKTNFPGRTEKQQPLPKSEKVAKRGRGASESSSGGTESSGGGGQDERSGRDGEALSSPASSAVAENARPNSSAAMPAVAMANMTFPPGHPGGFPMMPGHPFPFPLPMPPGGGAPFSMPFPFPYVMQFAPGPVGDANNNNNNNNNNNPDQPQQQQRPFQIALPPGFNPQFQIQAPDGAPTWASAVVRPHAATPPHSPPRNGTGTKPDEKRGVKTSRNAPEPSSQSSLVKANSMGSGAFNRLRSASVAPANGSPLAPQFGISRSKSDAVALRRDGSVGSAFAALGELPFHPAPKSAVPSPAAPVAEDREQNASTPANTAASEETSNRRPPSQPQPTGVWRQGSVPSFEGIAGHEASSLRPGVAPGVQFGGTGSPPDLPWVTCNGTISGVLYRVEKGQVRIVCACHGRHMTPAEFVQHAGCGEIPNPEKAIVVGPFAVLPQQPASAQA